MTYDVVCADVLEWAAGYDGEPFHAMLCDPPYHLTNRVVDWKGFSDPHQGGRGEPVLKRESGGFMGKKWDGGDISFQSETWAALAEHLLPGAFIMAFSGARTYHRMAVAMEDAGLIMHPSIFGWAYGSGFPKATRIDTQIDGRKGFKPNFAHDVQDFLNEGRKCKGLTHKELNRAFGFPDNSGMASHWCGDRTQPIIPRLEYWPKLKELLGLDDRFDEAITAHEREVVSKQYKGSSPLPGNHNGSWIDGQIDGEYDITATATDLAAQWQGHRYGLQAMKPACEPLLIFTKPLRVNPFCGIMTEITFLMEVLSCIHLNVQDAESLTNHLHQRLRAVVDNSVQKNADDWASLGNVTIAGDSSVSSLAGLTLADFVAGPVPTPDAMHQVVSSLGIGEAASLSAKDTDTYGRMADTLQSIVWLWNECLGELSIAANTSTTEMATVLTTDLKILKLCLRQIISDVITQQSEPTGKLSFVHSVESLLRSLVVKLPLLKNTTAIESVSDRLAQQDSDREESPRDGASLSPILLFQKPWEGKRLDCIVETGAGSLWIDGGRISAGEDHKRNCDRNEVESHWRRNASPRQRVEAHSAGRWPSNFTLTHSPGCVRDGVRRVKGDNRKAPTATGKGGIWAESTGHPAGVLYGDESVANWRCVEGCPVQRLGEQSGESVGSHNQIHNAGTGTSQSVYGELEFKALVAQAGYNDKGSPARFFQQSDWSYEVAERLAGADAVRCAVCLTELPKHSIMSETQSGGSLCDSVNGVEVSSNPSDQNNDSVEGLAAQRQQHASGGKSDLSSSLVKRVGRSGKTTPATTGDIAQEHVHLTQSEQLARTVKSAVNLCDLCATAIAQSLVQMQQGKDPASIHGLPSMPERKQQILIQSLVSSVENLEPTDITQIIQDQSLLSGIVCGAIEDYIQKVKRQDQKPSAFHDVVATQIENADPVRYQSKAARKERDAGLDEMALQSLDAYSGSMKKLTDQRMKEQQNRLPRRNPHPCCKPIALTQWLATLLLPPDAYAPRRILIPFAGSGSEAIGAMLTGWEHITLVEMDSDYCDIARARLAWWVEQARGQMWSDVKQILKNAK